MTHRHHDETARLADQLERSFHGGAWHGPAIAEALDGVGADLAARRPLRSAHTVWEITEHLRFWIEAARRRIEGEVIEVREPDDWPPVAAGAAAWEETRARLAAAHRGLRSLVEELEDARLDDPVSGSDPTVRGLLLGLLQHNAYHAGQIALLRKAEGER